MIAGHETTSNLLTWTFLLLAQHPHVTHKLCNEIDAVLGPPGTHSTCEGISHCTIEKIHYAECVLREALRLYPPAPYTAREAKDEDVIGDLRIRKGMTVFVSVYSIHRDRSLWGNDAEQFVPERWKNGPLPEKTGAFIPFGLGPRRCLGERFALLEARLALVRTLMEFLPIAVKDERIRETVTLTLGPKGGLRIEFVKRSTTSPPPPPPPANVPTTISSASPPAGMAVTAPSS